MAEPEAFAIRPPTSEPAATPCSAGLPPEPSQRNQSTQQPYSSRSTALSGLLTRALACVREMGTMTTPGWLRERCKSSIARLVATAGFVIACVALWSTISATSDGRKAEILAEWTAKKDFLEFCHEMSYELPGCETAKTMTLDPPPHFSKRGRTRPVLTESDTDWVNLVPILTVLICCIWAGCRRRIRLLVRLMRRIPGKSVNMQVRQSAGEIHGDIDTRVSQEKVAVFGQISDFNFDFQHVVPIKAMTSGLDLPAEHSAPRRRTAKKKMPISFGTSNSSNLEGRRDRENPLWNSPSIGSKRQALSSERDLSDEGGQIKHRTLGNLTTRPNFMFGYSIFPSLTLTLPDPIPPDMQTLDLIPSDLIPSDMIPSFSLSPLGPYNESFIPISEASIKRDQKKWICRDPSLVSIPHSETPTKPLSECKSCVTKKQYGAYYNAAAHLRRVHFKTKKKPTRRNEENRSGKGGGDWPPMSELKLWMEEVTVLVDVD